MESELRRLRKAIDLSQEDVAFLLGDSMTGGMVSRHENGNRHPNLFVLLGYCFILQKDVAGLYQVLDETIQDKIRTRAKVLHSQLELARLTPKTSRRLATLRSICDSSLA